METLLGAYARDTGCASIFLGSDSTHHHTQGASQLKSKTELCRSLDSVYKSSLCSEITGLASDQTRRVLDITNYNGSLTTPTKNEFNCTRMSKPNAPISSSSQHPRHHVNSIVNPTPKSTVLLSEETLSTNKLQLSASYKSAPTTERIGHAKTCRCSSSNSLKTSTIKNSSGMYMYYVEYNIIAYNIHMYLSKLN